MCSYTCDTAHLKRVSAAFAELAAECWVGERLTHEQLTEVRVQRVATQHCGLALPLADGPGRSAWSDRTVRFDRIALFIWSQSHCR